MAVSKSKTTRKLQLVTKAPKLSRKARKTADWLDKQYEGPVTLSRQQFNEVYDAVMLAAIDLQSTIESLTPADGEYDEETIGVVRAAEADFTRLNRLLYQFEGYLQGHEPRLNSQFKVRKPLMEQRVRIACGAA